MEFSKKQVQKMGEVAENFSATAPVEITATNLHDGSTVAMDGLDSRKRHITWLVNRRGVANELSALLHSRPITPARSTGNGTAKRGSKRTGGVDTKAAAARRADRHS